MIHSVGVFRRLACYRTVGVQGKGMVHGIGFSAKDVAMAGAIIVVAVLTACQDYRDAFNPVQLLCPGDFDSGENKCVIQTRGNVDP